MLNIIGIGLRGYKSITLEQLDAIKNSDIVYFETYTSISPENTFDYLRSITGKKLIKADRNTVESSNEIIKNALNSNVSFIVTGDALTATTHNELRLEAIKNGIDVKIFENASIFTAFPSRTGLFNYRFGPVISLPFIYENFFPLSVYDKIYKNYVNDFHTLILLDLKNGQTMEINEALDILIKMEEKSNGNIINYDTFIIAGFNIAREDEYIIAGHIKDVINKKISMSPASIILPAKLNDKEIEFVKIFCDNV